MKIAPTLRSLSANFVRIAMVSQLLAVAATADSLPSIQSIYDNSRAPSRKTVEQPVVLKSKVAVVKTKTIPSKLPAIAASPKKSPRVTFNEPATASIAVKNKSSVAKPAAPESLRNPETAKKLDLSKIPLFGPLSSSFRYDSRMVKAMEIASARAYAHSQGSCWRYVKNALLSAGLVDSRPTSAYAKEAASELTEKYGFRRISCSDPYKAPLGSVLVYGGRGAGHVEFRTRTGFVSDFTNTKPSARPLVGVYVK